MRCMCDCARIGVNRDALEARRADLSHLRGHGVEELPVIDDRSARRLRLRAPHDDHELLRRIDVDVLAEDADRLEGAIASLLRRRAGPPEVAIRERASAAQRLRRRRLRDPSLRKNLLAARHAAIENELSEATVVAQRRAEAAAAD